MNVIEKPDPPKHPLTYTDDRHIMFVDADGKHFFWNETHSNAVGPYDTIWECKYELWKYGRLIDVGLSVNFPNYSVIEGFIEAVVAELSDKDGEDE